MAKATILDRLAGAMKTLGKREGKALTPRQRVAAAQRWNSLAGVGEKRFISADERANSFDPTVAARGAFERDNIRRNLVDMRLMGTDGWTRGDNPFLSDNIDKYAEQSDFLDWCRYKGVEPNARNLKQYRWEEYQKLPYRQQQWIANKDGILENVGSEDPVEFRNARTLRDWDNASKEWMGSEWDLQDLPVYKSAKEFPDNFDYTWRY